MRVLIIAVVWIISTGTSYAQDTVRVDIIDAWPTYSCYYSITGKPVLILSATDIKKKMGLHRWGSKKCNQLELDSCKVEFDQYGLLVWDTITVIPRDRISTNLYELKKEKKYLFVVKMDPPEYSQMVERGFAVRTLVPHVKKKYKFEFVIQK